MYKQAQLGFAEAELLNQEIFFINTVSRVILDLEMAKKLIGACNQMLSTEKNKCGYVIDMSGVAFITEDSRNFITEESSHIGKVEALALVSNNHLGNIISTLMISCADKESIPMRLFKTPTSAQEWIQNKLNMSKVQLVNIA
jgi:hypothetical protein